MNDKTRNEFASFGLEILKKSALLVLYEARDAGLIRQNEVRERLGISDIIWNDPARHNALIFGILKHFRTYAKSSNLGIFNPKRPHSALGYLTPIEFQRQNLS